jgi:predicted 2-oxoglutarate/Fe(II)-dependent dioxygenase YbiX
MYVPPFALKPTEVIGGCIAIWHNAWSEPSKTIEMFERISSDENSKINFSQAKTVGNENNDNSKKRTNSHLSLSDGAKINEEFRQVNNQYLDLIYSAALYYEETFAPNLGFHITEGFNVLRYQTGEEYKAHFDGATATHRSFSPILYLNDDYTGGELEFVYHNIKIKPKAGMLAMFPASFPYAHIAHPVKTGTKYAIVTWLHDQL